MASLDMHLTLCTFYSGWRNAVTFANVHTRTWGISDCSFVM